jgi:hypothetical protein
VWPAGERRELDDGFVSVPFWGEYFRVDGEWTTGMEKMKRGKGKKTPNERPVKEQPKGAAKAKTANGAIKRANNGNGKVAKASARVGSHSPVPRLARRP